MNVLVTTSKLREMKNYKQQVERGDVFKKALLKEVEFTQTDFNIICYILETFNLGVDSPAERFLFSRYKKDLEDAKKFNLNIDMAYYVLKTYL